MLSGADRVLPLLFPFACHHQGIVRRPAPADHHYPRSGGSFRRICAWPSSSLAAASDLPGPQTPSPQWTENLPAGTPCRRRAPTGFLPVEPPARSKNGEGAISRRLRTAQGGQPHRPDGHRPCGLPIDAEAAVIPHEHQAHRTPGHATELDAENPVLSKGHSPQKEYPQCRDRRLLRKAMRCHADQDDRTCRKKRRPNNSSFSPQDRRFSRQCAGWSKSHVFYDLKIKYDCEASNSCFLFGEG